MKPVIEKFIKARPTLAGLVVESTFSDGSSQSTCYTWDRVDCFQQGFLLSQWLAYENDGNRFRVGARNLSLNIRGIHATNVAKRAQERWLRRAFKTGELDVTLQNNRGVGDWGVFVLATIVSLGLAVASVVRGVGIWQQSDLLLLPFKWVLLSRGLAICIAVGVPVFCYQVVKRLNQFLIQPNAQWIRFTGQGIVALMQNGETLEAGWRGVSIPQQQGQCVRLKLSNRSIVWLSPSCGHGRMLCDVLQGQLSSGQEPSRRDKERSLLVRLGWYWLIGGAMAGAILVFALPDLGILGGLLFASLFWGCGVLTWASDVLPSKVERLLRRRKRRRSREKRGEERSRTDSQD